MAAIDQTANSKKTICWARGDTIPRVFTIKDSAGVVTDISGSTFRMRVNTEKDPNTGSPGTILFTAIGTFVTDGTDGKVQFAPTPVTWADALTLPTTAFYDIEETVTATSTVETLIKGGVKIEQDISK